MLPKITIVVLNWNGFEDTVNCLESLRNIEYSNYEVILIDNCSNGNDVEIIKSKYGEYLKQIIVSQSNLGFSGGNNLGIKSAISNEADAILLLNNDTIVQPDFLIKLINASNENPNASILAPKINFFSSPTLIWSAGGKISKLRATGLSSGFKKDDKSILKNSFCTFASGCCLYIKKEVFEKIGLLDEEYFLYLEDTDFCYRAIKAKFKILFVWESKIFHKVQATTAKESSLLPIYYSIRNRLYFAKKNLGVIYYFSFCYILMAFAFKLIFVEKEKRKIFNTVCLSVKHHFSKRMGNSFYQLDTK